MLRFDKIVFGPIRSRRLGSSLGINLLPENGKLCNFDCIYCECGWNKDGRIEGGIALPAADDVADALEAKLKACAADGIGIDSITFSGNGEPTLNPSFPEIIDITLALRDKYFPDAKVSVLSNATMLGRDKVVAALKKVDNPILKIDAPTNAGAAIINGPSGSYDVDAVVAGLKKFDGNFILQTMFLKSPDFDSSAPENISGWKKLVRELKPKEIMVYTIDRETPAKNLGKFTAEEMRELTRDLVEEVFEYR